MRNLRVSRIHGDAFSERNTEYVERKGIGHPDSLIDGIVDSTSNALCRAYIENFDAILHHNVDKGLIIGGEAEVSYGKGRITKKIEVIVTGRATESIGKTKIDVNGIAKETAMKYLKDNTRFLDLENEVKFESKIAKGSGDLVHLFQRGSKNAALANDTSFGVGFAPFSDTEKLVLATEKYLNSKEYKKKFPAVGEDIKVMGLREGSSISLTIAIAFVAKYVKDKEEYARYKGEIKKDVKALAKKAIHKEVTVHVNTADPEDGERVYLTKSGLSCEQGDDGSVGRGNRVNGLITPFRTMSLEAASGKNPVSHIGKIYNILATEMANAIVKEHPSITECNVSILSQIGRRIDDPHNLSIEINAEKEENFDNVRSKAAYTAESLLDRLPEITYEISIGKYGTF